MEFVSAPMQMALDLAHQALRLTSPNPRVGCVIVDQRGQVLGKGHTQKAGGPHAEIVALSDAKANGYSVQGATAYVTLEPCSHFGRTGPCCDKLVESGIAKVVASLEDPNPLVSGHGFKRLTDAGIKVEIGDGAHQSKELNLGFFSRMIRHRPWTRLKVAMSLDGFTALPNGTSQWITSPEARTDGHQWRARACAILTGIGTILKDDPRLDVRLEDQQRQPSLAILDSRLQITPEHKALAALRSVYVFSRESDSTFASKGYGDNVRHVCSSLRNGQLDLAAVMQFMNERETNELHVEAGATLNGSLLSAGLIDEIVVYVAPKLLQQGFPIARMPALLNIEQAVQWRFVESQQIGQDTRLIVRTGNPF